MRQQRLFQQVAADARAAALVADLETPAADGARHAVAAHQIGRAGAEDGDRAVAVIADRAFERDQRVGHDAAAREGQDGFELLGIGADIGAREAKHRRRLADQRRILAGFGKGQPRRLHDVLARAGQVGADVGGTALAAPDDIAVSGRERRPATRAAAIDAEQERQGFLRQSG